MPEAKGVVRPTHSRHLGVDLGRLVGVYAVILLHQSSEDYGSAGIISDVLDQLARWAVPFFFIASGYFLVREQPWQTVVAKSSRRILPIFLFWCLFYPWFYGRDLPELSEPLSILKLFMTGGTGYHLWFLSSLLICICAAAAFLQRARYGSLTFLALLAFGLGLVLGPYSPVFCGEHLACVSFSHRDGLTFGLIFLVLGILLNSGHLNRFRGKGLQIACFGVFLSVAEVYALNIFYDVDPTAHDFVLGTLPFGFGVALLFFDATIRRDDLAKVIQQLAPVSLGMYAIHVLFLHELTSKLEPGSLASGLFVSVATFILSAIVAYVGSKVMYLRRVFM